MLCLQHTKTGEKNGIRQAVEMDSEMQQVLDSINLFFLICFTLEMLIKLVGLGPMGYTSSWLNIFDMATVIVGLIEIGFSGSSSVTAVRCLRLVRVGRISRTWTSIQTMFESIAKAVPSLFYFGILVLLYLYMAAVVGISLFGGKFDPEHGLVDTPRSNYDNFGVACLTTFQILTGQ